jgi:holo-[acyl-carrier protein] synthase
VILGTGIDIVEVDRIRRACERFGDRFLRRILRPGEIEYCASCKFSAPHIAARFAAKEAISKAFGTGIGRQLGWLDMEIQRKTSGEPFVVLHEGGEVLLLQRGGDRVHISLSHTQAHATAVAIIEG